MIQVPISLNSG